MFFAAAPPSPRFAASELYSARELEPRRRPAGLRICPVQSPGPRFAGAIGGRGTFRGMPDPRLELTAQELIYAATALRAEARRSAERGRDPQYGSTQEIFRRAACGTEALAGKIQRIADQVGRPGNALNSTG